jgi:AraC-like DNA-binding protein
MLISVRAPVAYAWIWVSSTPLSGAAIADTVRITMSPRRQPPPRRKHPPLPTLWTIGRQRNAQGWEYAVNPSPVARRLWTYLLNCGRSRCPAGFSMQYRRHPDYLLHYVRGGTLAHTVDGHAFDVHAGEAALFPLSGRVEYRVTSHAPVDLFWVLLNGKDVPHLLTAWNLEEDPVVCHLDLRAMDRAMEQLLRRVAIQRPATEALTSVALQTLLAHLFTARSSELKAGPLDLTGRPLSPPVRAALGVIIHHYSMPIQVKGLAGNVGVTPNYLSARFRREVGMPLREWLNRYRIEQAKQLLTETRQPLQLIGAQVGLPVPAHFARLFRKYVGLPARQYRRRPV